MPNSSIGLVDILGNGEVFVKYLAPGVRVAFILDDGAPIELLELEPRDLNEAAGAPPPTR